MGLALLLIACQSSNEVGLSYASGNLDLTPREIKVAMVVQGPETDNLVDDITSACTDANPYYAVAVKPRLAKGDPSIALIRDTTVGMLFEDTSMWHILAAEQDTGTIHGLAYDATRSHLYAAGIFSNDYLVRPSDLGLIYRIDLTTRKLTTVATLPAGSDLRPKVQPLTGVIAPEIIHAIGRLGLGDIDVDEDGRYLFAMNLFDKRIYRLALPDMKGLIALPTGDGMAKADEEVLPFGIGVRNGYLYHGVVILPAEGPAEYVPRVALYRSTLEGDDLQLLAMDELRYRRQGPWQAWRDSRYPDSSHAYRNVVEPQLLDIEFTATGLPIIGIGNRRMWIFQSSYYGGGNALPTELDHEDRLSIRLDPDYFADAHDVPLYPDSPLQHDVLNGTLAPGPVRGQLVATTWDSEASGGLRWLSTEAPTLAGPINGVEAVFGDRGAVGDIERLCPPDRLSPSATPTPTDLFLATDTPQYFRIWQPRGWYRHKRALTAYWS